MSLTVTVAQVKEKCRLSGSGEDSAIQNLIDSTVPTIELEIREEALGSADAGVQATLLLGAVEMVSGEFLAQLMREKGVLDTVRIGGTEIRPFIPDRISDPYGLKAMGAARLRPYRKDDASGFAAAEIWAGGDRSGLDDNGGGS